MQTNESKGKKYIDKRESEHKPTFHALFVWREKKKEEFNSTNKQILVSKRENHCPIVLYRLQSEPSDREMKREREKKFQ